MAVNLTPGAISKISTGACTYKDLKPELQLMYIDRRLTRTIDNKQWCVVKLSDGSFWQFGHIANEIILSKKLQIGSIVQLTKFQLTKSSTGEIRYIFVCDLKVIRRKCGIIGNPTLIRCNETPSMEKSVLRISDHDRVDPDEDEDDDSHHVKEVAASKQKPSASTRMCSSHSQIQNDKQKLQSSEQVDVGLKKFETLEEYLRACFNKLETLEKVVGACFNKLETLEDDVSMLKKMRMETNKEDDILELKIQEPICGIALEAGELCEVGKKC